jgi:peroxiredoxin Q/BCP
MSMPKPDEMAPDFVVLNDQGQEVRLSDLRGKRVVLYFYPSADSPTCTKEACGFRDDFDEFEEKGMLVLGISPDPPSKLARFRKKWNLPLGLLADHKHEQSLNYGVWGPKQLFGRAYDGVHRTTFIVDETGRIAKVYENVASDGHSREILNDFSAEN